MARMPVKSVELKLTKGSGENGAGSSGGNYSSKNNNVSVERRSVEALDRDNSRRLGDLGIL